MMLGLRFFAVQNAQTPPGLPVVAQGLFPRHGRCASTGSRGGVGGSGRGRDPCRAKRGLAMCRRGTTRTFHEISCAARDDERSRTHRGLPRRGRLTRDDRVVRVHLVVETALVGAVPGRLQEDSEALPRLRELALHREERLLPRVPYRWPARGEDRGELGGEERLRRIVREIEVATDEDAAGLAEHYDGRARTFSADAKRARVRTQQLVVRQDDVRPIGNACRILLVDRDLHAEGLAVSRGVGGARRVRRDEQRRASRPAHETEGALAERRSVDQEVAAVRVEDDVLPLVLERFVELEDPRAELMDVHGVSYPSRGSTSKPSSRTTPRFASRRAIADRARSSPQSKILATCFSVTPPASSSKRSRMATIASAEVRRSAARTVSG